MFDELSDFLRNSVPIDVFCIGSPNVVGDSLGPLVGTMLKESVINYNVQIIGTLSDPVIKSTFVDKVRLIRPETLVIAIDASIGTRIGEIDFAKGSIKPGAGINNHMPPVGHYYLKCYTANSSVGLLFSDEAMVHKLSTHICRTLVDLFNTSRNKVYVG